MQKSITLKELREEKNETSIQHTNPVSTCALNFQLIKKLDFRLHHII